MVGTATAKRAAEPRIVELTRPDQELVRRVAARPVSRSSGSVVRLIVFGAASATLYGIFFTFVDDISSLLTSGSVVGAAAVIGLALTTSLIHGSFAGALLDVVGFRALKKG
jgi:heme O synthase-like polyprenyltransferase